MTCSLNSKPVYKDGACCPTCEIRNECDNTLECPACEEGTTATRVDLQCCPLCLKPDYCDTVLCAKPDCPEEKMIRRVGECCPQCPLCSDETTRVCDRNDDHDCKEGYYRGDNCDVQVPEADRRFKILIIRYCRKDNQECIFLDTTTMRIMFSILGGIDESRIDVEFIGNVSIAGRACCVKYKVTITVDIVLDGTADANAEAAALATAIGSNPDFLVEGEETPDGSDTISSASTFFLSFIGLATILLALL
jgi:hypothetical protein